MEGGWGSPRELSKQAVHLMNAAQRRCMSEDGCSEPRTPEWITQLG